MRLWIGDERERKTSKRGLSMPTMQDALLGYGTLKSIRKRTRRGKNWLGVTGSQFQPYVR